MATETMAVSSSYEKKTVPYIHIRYYNGRYLSVCLAVSVACTITKALVTGLIHTYLLGKLLLFD